ncbi:MAG: putative heme transporter [Solirubrobacteraceae bacterium]|nr:putative heme transporter [Solirubrobacteraceae bacterium]
MATGDRARVPTLQGAPTKLGAEQGTSQAPPSRRGRFLRRRGHAVTAVIGVAAVAGFIQFVVPQLSALGPTLHRLRAADPKWLGFGIVLEGLSLAGYVALFRTVFSCHGVRIGWKASYQITMAGVVATKLFAAAGAGGVALTVWALRASGLSARAVTRRVLTFEFFLYGVYAGTLVVGGVGLRSGLLSGSAPWTLTVAPAVLALTAIGLLLSMRWLPNDFERRMKPLAGARRGRQLLARLSSAPWAVHDALGIGFTLVRERKPGLIGAVAYWGFDIATLWACFHAFGSPPTVAVIVMAYFVGALANTLPVPGGLGGVEAGMVGAFLAFGTHGSLAILAVLSYRLISFWLPTIPGAAAYLQLRRTVSVWRRETKGRQPAPVARLGHPTKSLPDGRKIIVAVELGSHDLRTRRSQMRGFFRPYRAAMTG